MIHLRFAAVAAVLIVSACNPPRNAAESMRSDPDGSALILRGSELGGHNFLDGLRTRVQNVTVTYSQTGCPRITLRGRRAGGNPGVYIDGTLLADTCALLDLSSSDVDVVEIYRSGNTRRPGIRSNPNGLILVYRLR